MFITVEGWADEWIRKTGDGWILFVGVLHKIGRGWIGGNVVIILVDSNFIRESQQQNKTKLNKLDLTLVQCENGDRY